MAAGSQAALPKVCSLGAEVEGYVINWPSWLPVGLFIYLSSQAVSFFLLFPMGHVQRCKVLSTERSILHLYKVS